MCEQQRKREENIRRREEEQRRREEEQRLRLEGQKRQREEEERKRRLEEVDRARSGQKTSIRSQQIAVKVRLRVAILCIELYIQVLMCVLTQGW